MEKSLKVYRGRLTHGPGFCVRLEDHDTCQFPLHLHREREHSLKDMRVLDSNANMSGYLKCRRAQQMLTERKLGLLKETGLQPSVFF